MAGQAPGARRCSRDPAEVGVHREGGSVAAWGSNRVSLGGSADADGNRHRGKGGVDGAESAEGVATEGSNGVENVALAVLLRQQAERRVRAWLRVPHGCGGRRRYSWGKLLQRTLQDCHPAASCVGVIGSGLSDVLRTFGIVVLVCSQCSGGAAGAGGDPRSGVIAWVLLAMGLASSVPKQAGERCVQLTRSWRERARNGPV
jgi:hypothetical protein